MEIVTTVRDCKNCVWMATRIAYSEVDKNQRCAVEMHAKEGTGLQGNSSNKSNGKQRRLYYTDYPTVSNKRPNWLKIVILFRLYFITSCLIGDIGIHIRRLLSSRWADVDGSSCWEIVSRVREFTKSDKNRSFIKKYHTRQSTLSFYVILRLQTPLPFRELTSLPL